MRVLFTILLIAAVLAPAAMAQTTTLQAKISLRPLTRDDIAASKLPSTVQTSGGLSTVGLGQPLYLEALLDGTIPPAEILGVTWDITRKPANSQASLVDSPLGDTVPIYEPSDRAAFQLAGRMMLRPDLVGIYTVTAKISTAKNGTAELVRMLVGSTYLGNTKCVGCHNGGGAPPWSMAGMWSKTTHASIFKNGMNGVASDHYGPGCLACHTAGYDQNPLAVNGGFDDVADQLKWKFPTVLTAGTFDALPAELKNLGNVQCENCHGPGSQHVASGGNPLEISKSFDSGVCGQCHGALTHHSKTGEWNNSLHAATTRDPSGAGREGCVGCHTGSGFMDRIKGVAPTTTDFSAINCQTCHEPHGDTKPGDNARLLRTLDTVTLKDGTTVSSAGKGVLCMNCHQSRQNASVYAATAAASARFGPHHSPQADMLQGVNGFTYGKSLPTSAHSFIVEDTCVTCHMQTVDAASPALTHAGGHTFKLRSADGSAELTAACQKCHGPTLTTLDFPLIDYDGDGQTDGVQTEVRHLLDKLALMLPPAGKAKTALTIDSTWTRPQLEAGYNWQFVNNDGSFGIHNMAYAVGLLKASIADLEAKK